MKFKYLGSLPEFKVIHHSSMSTDARVVYSGSQAPTHDLVYENNELRSRVYFSARDEWNQSHSFYYDLDLDNPLKVLYKHEESLIPLGAPGEADENGTMFSGVDSYGRWLYTGWNKTDRNDVRYRTACMWFDPKTKEKGIIADRTTLGTCGTSMPSPVPYSDDVLLMEYSGWSDSEPKYHIGSKFEDFFIGAPNKALARPVYLRGYEDEEYYIYYSERGLIDYRTNPSEMYKLKVQYCNNYDPIRTRDTEIEGDDSPMKAYAYPFNCNGTFILYNRESFTSAIGVAASIND